MGIKAGPDLGLLVELDPDLSVLVEVIELTQEYADGRKSFTSVPSMRDDMGTLSAKLVWLGTLTGNLDGRGQTEKRHNTQVEKQKYAELRFAKTPTDRAKAQAAAYALEQYDDLLPSLVEMMTNVYNSGWKFVDVLKKCIAISSGSDAGYSRSS